VSPAADPAAIAQALRAAGLLAVGRPVLVMVSGGRDSVCLLDLAVAVVGAGAVRALHVNYGLRAGAGLDEELCRSLCERLGVELEVRRPARDRAGNLQAWARDERYRAARELAGGEDIAVGHTASDQVETILYRLASSPSRRALLGMAPREGTLVRPLLALTRQDTAAYCAARGLTWREDESNDEPAYARARVRHHLVPALRAIHPAAEANVLALAGRLREEGDVLDALVSEVLGSAGDIELARLAALHPALARLVVQRLADAAAGRPAPGVGARAPELLRSSTWAEGCARCAEPGAWPSSRWAERAPRAGAAGVHTLR
jgi:tRNA(Ile)-lysidine synthase